MKSILLIIFLLPLTVIGQELGYRSLPYSAIEKATPNTFLDRANYATDTTILGAYTGYYNTQAVSRKFITIYDTIKVILLVSDSSIPGNNKVVWIKGWEVRKKYDNIPIALQSLLEPEEYLDIIKNKLNKNIIVWMSKNN